MKQSTIDFLKTLTDGEDPTTGMPVFGIEHGGMFIHDPYLSSCGRFDAKPSDYGLTKESADLLVALNRLIDDSAEASISAANLAVSTRAGVHGDSVFAMRFSDGELASAIASAFDAEALKIALAGTLRTQIRNEVWPAAANDEAELDSQSSASEPASQSHRPERPN